MRSNLDFDQKLLAEAQKIGGFKYKKDTINAALAEYVNRHKQLKIIDLFGKIDYDEEYDYKKERKKR